jgi:hypothetical protein
MAYGMKPPSRVADTPTARSWPAGHDAHLLTKEPLVKKHLLAVVAAIAMLAAAAPAHAAKSCGSLRVSGPWGSGVHVTVRVMKGNVGCVEARRLARALFTGRGSYHNGGYGYNSWWILPGGWTGDGNTGGWMLINRSRNARIGGSY